MLYQPYLDCLSFSFPGQLIKLYLKTSSGGNKKTTRNTPNKNLKENSSAITIKKFRRNAGEKKFKPCEKNIKSYLLTNNELLSKRINELKVKLFFPSKFILYIYIKLQIKLCKITNFKVALFGILS